jgi:hypothetical protein
MPHVPAYPGAECELPAGAEGLTFDQASAWETALDNLVRWVADGKVAPKAPRIAVEADGKTASRDEHGNALGGMRTLQVEVPTAMLTATSLNAGGVFGSPCAFLGYQVPFDDATLTSLYGDHDGYVRAITERANQLVRDGLLLRARARDDISAAKESSVLASTPSS